MVEKRIRTWVICSQAPDDKSVGWLDTTVWDQWQIKIYHDDGWKTVKAIDDDELQAQIQEIIEALNNRYTKSETYSKSEVNNLLSNFSGFIVVETLPETGDSTKIYLLGPIGTGTDKYEEWIYSNNAWVKIGDTSIDLSGYLPLSGGTMSGPLTNNDWIIAKNISIRTEPQHDTDGVTKKYVDDNLNNYAKKVDVPVEKSAGVDSVIQKGSTNQANGSYSACFGRNNKCLGRHSFAEGLLNTASGNESHAEGTNTTAEGNQSHAEGGFSAANSQYSHSEGDSCTSNGDASHAEGKGSITNNIGEHSEGQFNISIPGVTMHTVGIGSHSSTRKNAHTVTIDGKHYIPGIGTYTGTETTLPDGQDLATIVNAKANSSSLATVATSGSYTDLSNKPTIPTVNDAILTIQKNGVDVQTFSANASSNITANITVPTQASDINAAAATHTHTTSITTDSGTADIALTYGGQYKLSSGGTNVVFTMPATSTSDVFWVTYGVTTYAECKTAFDAGKVLMMKYDHEGDDYFIMVGQVWYGWQSFFFSCTDGVYLWSTHVGGSGWTSVSSVTLEYTSRKISSISGNETDTNKYTTAKAVNEVTAKITIPAAAVSTGDITINDGVIIIPRAGYAANVTYIFTLSNFHTALVSSMGRISTASTARDKADEIYELLRGKTGIREHGMAGNVTISTYCVQTSIHYFTPVSQKREHQFTYADVSSTSTANFYVAISIDDETVTITTNEGYPQ